MKVKVEHCNNGNNRFSFRVTLPDGTRNHFPDEGENGWTRKLAGEVKDFLSYHYRLKRQNIKFD